MIKNIFNPPLICFLIGGFSSLIRHGLRLPAGFNKLLTVYILFCVGLKGGGPLVEHSASSALIFSIILTALIIWGLLNPLISFYLIKSSTQVDSLTAAAIAASFGSVSVITFITAISFLDQLKAPYQELIIAMLAIMEIPAIISGVFIAKKSEQTRWRQTSHPEIPTQTKTDCSGCLEINRPESVARLLREALFNKAILSIILGIIAGAFFYKNNLNKFSESILISFKPLLCLFLFDMGLNVGLQRQHFRSFSWPLILFGLYMPLIGASFGLVLSYILGLDAGTGTLIQVLTASASYIAVPAAMRIALPQAKEAIYLPLSLGIAFPFNVIIGIPLYYYLSVCFL